LTVPFPVPLQPELIPIQSQLPELVEAVQEHPAPAVTLTLPEPASFPTGWLVGLIVNVQVLMFTEIELDQEESTLVSVAHRA
jgi:hypothetical protein